MVDVRTCLVAITLICAVSGEASAATFTTLHAFTDASGDGANPYASLLNVGGVLYGTTINGGSGNGTVFKVNPTTGAESVVHAFSSGADGDHPYASLLNVGGMLYGTTSQSGFGFPGTVFEFNPVNGTESIVHTFEAADGAEPYASLIDVKGSLYGTTISGGTASAGTVFKINLATGAESVVFSFNGGTSGSHPYASLINVGGILYGTTNQGGTGYGTVFKINPVTGAESIVYSFTNVRGDGAYPTTSLLNVGGTLYGTTSQGGATGSSGTVFKINPASGAESIVHSFNSSTDGFTPTASLIKVGNILYGTTIRGGTASAGTVFKISPATGAETVVYSFSVADGSPGASLLNVGGILYGTTQFGGTSYGTVFRFKP
jgi:uncharacterized repeat protein (TIGR03803 family)